MYAIVEDRGRSQRVEVGQKLTVDLLDQEVGSEITFPVQLISGDDGVQIGTPLIDGAKVVAKVVRHEQGAKGVAGFYRRRKDSRRRFGFRHQLTALEVVSIA